MPTFGLVMIVKNEAQIIKKCLASVAPYISRWDICDTGSTDNTIKVINNFFKDKNIPGQVHEHAWEGFADNRTLAFQVDEGNTDWMYVIDADDELITPLHIPAGCEDAHSLIIDLQEGPSVTQCRQQLFKSGCKWGFASIVHEFPYSEKYPAGKLRVMQTHEIKVKASRGGDRSKDPLKYFKDGMLIEMDLERVMAIPKHKLKHWETEMESRYKYYAAQSWFDYKHYERALFWCDERVKVNGFKEEIYRAYLTKGRCLRNILMRAVRLNADPRNKTKVIPVYNGKTITNKMIIDAFEECHRYDPYRAEAAFEIAQEYEQTGNYKKALEYINLCLKIKRPKDKLFIVEDYVYDFGSRMVASRVLEKLEEYEKAFKIADQLWRESKDPSKRMWAYNYKHSLVPKLLPIYFQGEIKREKSTKNGIIVNIVYSSLENLKRCLSSMSATWLDFHEVDNIYIDFKDVVKDRSEIEKNVLSLFPFLISGKGTGEQLSIYTDDTRCYFNKIAMVEYILSTGKTVGCKILYLDTSKQDGELGVYKMTSVKKTPYAVFASGNNIYSVDTITSTAIVDKK
uniref:Glycosyltransferase 2-like domain-containing protein n=1 Tax=viral metagenome TaxID=1070528 RepID=A0A6C0JVD8_9ZZZZ